MAAAPSRFRAMNEGTRQIVILSREAGFARRMARMLEPDPGLELHHCEDVAALSPLIDGLPSDDDAHPIVIVGWDMQSEGAEELADVGAGDHGASILVVGPRLDDDDLLWFVASGADGFVRDESDPQVIRLAVSVLARRLSLVPRDLRQRMNGLIADSREAARQASPAALLTVREKEILAGIVAGQSNGAIARALNVSEGTVKAHVKSILQKTRSANRTQAAMRALRERIVER